MSRIIRAVPLLVALLISALFATPALSSGRIFAIQAGRLIVDASLPARGPSTVIVENGRIVRIEEGFTTGPSGATVVDMRHETVLPGLIDAHVHLGVDLAGGPTTSRKYSDPYRATIALANAAVMARAGFTTVRDVGGKTLVSLAVRDAAAEGRFPGPRILVAGQELSVIGGAGDMTVGLRPETAAALDEKYPQYLLCTGVDGCAEAVRRAGKSGVDLIKIYATGAVLDNVTTGLGQQFSDAEMRSIVETAHRLGLRVAAHAHSARGIEAAADAGVDSIEHGTFADQAAIATMKRHGTFLVPTLRAVVAGEEMLQAGKFDENRAAKAREVSAWIGRALTAAYRAGVPIALGTDAGVFPHGRAAEELKLMVDKGGMSPRDALAAATKGGARLLGLADETGTLDPGKSADLIAVAGDPLVDPTAVLQVRFVMVKGVPIALESAP